jgi:hypothetical protein
LPVFGAVALMAVSEFLVVVEGAAAFVAVVFAVAVFVMVSSVDDVRLPFGMQAS